MQIFMFVGPMDNNNDIEVQREEKAVEEHDKTRVTPVLYTNH